jgi:pantoate--beta-alanine ligase
VSLLLQSIESLKQYRSQISGDVGFVPTMGALHQGHGSLFTVARAQNVCVIASIFVNPAQFDDKNDLNAYPRTLDQDLEMAKNKGVDAVFLPTPQALYPEGYRFKLHEDGYSQTLCGADRPGHFDGVLTIVMKLLQLTKPHRAYFGEKDYQQFQLINDMAKDFFLDCEIMSMPTVREHDGLAMSSRNQRLGIMARQKAALFPKILNSDLSPEAVKCALIQEGFQVDYITDTKGRRYGAVRLGDDQGGMVRLIDNFPRVMSAL